MKKLILIAVLGVFFSCDSDEGKKLAREYCKCIMSAKGDIYMIGECEQDFKEDIDALEKKPRQYQDFMEELENCQ